MAQPPSFPFYAGDWIAGTATLSLEAKGAYIDLLAHQWNSHEGVPGADPVALSRIIRASKADAKRVWAELSGKFVLQPDGTYRNARVEREREAKARYHEAKRRNGEKGGRPRSTEQPTEGRTDRVTETKPTGYPPSPSPSPSVPTEQRDARADAPTRTERASRPNPYAHAQVKAPNGRVFWEGPIFDIPDGWAVKALKASNGKAVGSDVVKFAQALTAKLERDGAEAPAQGFLAWLDAEWAAYRQPAVRDGYRPASEFIEEQKRVAAEVAAEEAAAKANGTYRSLAQIMADARAARAAERKAATHG
jgi:uncharacterized protein YdaU (DUF1376 family)